jgi:hypothetical protein
MDILSLHTPVEWLMILSATFIIGLGKAGLKGGDMLSVTLMAFVFGGKSSTGIVLPLLCVADIAAVAYYNRHAKWTHYKKLVPWMMIGILGGVVLGKDLDEAVFRKIMAVTILLTIIIVLTMEYRKTDSLPDHPHFSVFTGLAAGFTTMIGNLAGAFANMYFLAMKVPMNDFIGTAAWIFLTMNLFKLPFQLFYWKNINFQSLQMDLVLLPSLALGFWLGIRIIGRIREEQFRKMVMILTLTGSLLMLFRR